MGVRDSRPQRPTDHPTQIVASAAAVEATEWLSWVLAPLEQSVFACEGMVRSDFGSNQNLTQLTARSPPLWGQGAFYT